MYRSVSLHERGLTRSAAIQNEKFRQSGRKKTIRTCSQRSLSVWTLQLEEELFGSWTGIKRLSSPCGESKTSSNRITQNPCDHSGLRVLPKSKGMTPAYRFTTIAFSEKLSSRLSYRQLQLSGPHSQYDSASPVSFHGPTPKTSRQNVSPIFTDPRLAKGPAISLTG